ncbi:MAG: hypothetical protein V3T33_04420 [Myxococcota bacterium]
MNRSAYPLGGSSGFSLPIAALALALVLVLAGDATGCGPGNRPDDSDTEAAQTGRRAESGREAPPRDSEREIAGLFGTDIELPQALPRDVPVYPGAEEIGAISAAGQGTIATFRSSDAPDQISHFYREALARQGWRVDRYADFGGEHVLSTSKGNRTVSVAITGNEGEAQITLRVVEDTRRP